MIALTFRLVQKCTVKNGGCDASAVCTNPTQAGEDPVCSCATGEQFASDGRTCTSTADAAKYCPTSTCWTYETVEGEKKCVMKLRVWHWKFDQSAARSETVTPRRSVIYNQSFWTTLNNFRWMSHQLIFKGSSWNKTILYGLNVTSPFSLNIESKSTHFLLFLKNFVLQDWILDFFVNSWSS